MRMEALKNRLDIGEISEVAAGIRRWMGSKESRRWRIRSWRWATRAAPLTNGGYWLGSKA
jgi:hypothetical protein